eukprot:CAMPEP_0172725724 /NCGR_PEP_ID=MMETSP1074-20121228/89070_1 /TAXON_ID=2916 /ORGANISM="Ceratium fusus, Strain PA161109" /LENGTH=250 /DNA_ID=CAMNT_0013552565 /DNA_START=188 /DNA_END=940 /DNA_ORIENTATION=+
MPCFLAVVGWGLMIFSLQCNRLLPICLRRALAKGLRALKHGDQRPFAAAQICGAIMLGTLPRTEAQLDELQEDHCIRFIITLNEPWELVWNSQVMREDVLKARDVQWLVLPTPDYNPPTLSDIRIAVDWSIRNAGIDCAADSVGDKKCKGGLYVHCNAGKGRSAVVVICLLMTLRGWTSKEAYDFVSSKRCISHMGLCGGRCLRTAQWQTILAYEQELPVGGRAAWQELNKGNEGNKPANNSPDGVLRAS